MPKRQNLRKRRSDDEEDEEADELLDVLADAAVPLARGGRDRKHGISILDSDKEESGVFFFLPCSVPGCESVSDASSATCYSQQEHQEATDIHMQLCRPT